MVWNHRKEQEDNCLYYDEHDEPVSKILVLNHKYVYSASKDGTIKRWYPRGSG